jgi:hypothetical protein
VMKVSNLDNKVFRMKPFLPSVWTMTIWYLLETGACRSAVVPQLQADSIVCDGWFHVTSMYRKFLCLKYVSFAVWISSFLTSTFLSLSDFLHLKGMSLINTVHRTHFLQWFMFSLGILTMTDK